MEHCSKRIIDSHLKTVRGEWRCNLTLKQFVGLGTCVATSPECHESVQPHLNKCIVHVPPAPPLQADVLTLHHQCAQSQVAGLGTPLPLAMFPKPTHSRFFNILKTKLRNIAIQTWHMCFLQNGCHRWWLLTEWGGTLDLVWYSVRIFIVAECSNWKMHTIHTTMKIY